MPTQRLTVSIPMPCQEDWSAMTPQTRGRFCSSCQKTVVDFTAMTDAEVVNWLSSRKGETCGRFRENQLERSLRVIPPKASSWKLKAFSFGIAAWLGIKSAEAQSKPERVPTIELLTISQPSVIAPAPKPDANSISGVVLVAPIGGVSQIKIRLNDTVETTPNERGSFTLPFSRDVPLEKQWLVISAVGYQTQRYRLADLQLDQLQRIALMREIDTQQFNVRLGGIAVTGVPVKTDNFFQGVYHRIEDFFR